eukprot:1139304-Pelagomonas_calceolata.AAC.2
MLDGNVSPAADQPNSRAVGQPFVTLVTLSLLMQGTFRQVSKRVVAVFVSRSEADTYLVKKAWSYKEKGASEVVVVSSDNQVLIGVPAFLLASAKLPLQAGTAPYSLPYRRCWWDNSHAQSPYFFDCPAAAAALTAFKDANQSRLKALQLLFSVTDEDYQITTRASDDTVSLEAITSPHMPLTITVDERG